MSPKEENRKKYYVWKHHTLTEYLASDYILRQKHPLKQAKEFMILNQKGITAFKNSWYGTLRFLIESSTAEQYAKWLIELGKTHPENIDDDFSQVILSVDPDKLGISTQAKLYELIYKTYQERILWLPAFTRSFIGKFFQPKHFTQLKADISPTTEEVGTYVHRGNVVAVIDSLFENENKYFSNDEKQFWKKKLIIFANDSNDNGVLQRHSLDALINYKDPTLIKKVQINFNHKESLVRESFVQFCYQTAPNNPIAIDFLVKAIKTGIIIYGRFGLYEITTKAGISYLLDKFSDDQHFLKIFIDRESIFDEGKDRGDFLLLKHIKEVIDKDILKKLECLLLYAFGQKEAYHLERSLFIQKIATIVLSHDKDFIFKLLTQLKAISSDQERMHMFFVVENILPYLIDLKNIDKFIKEMKIFPLDRAALEAKQAIYSARRLLGKRGIQMYEYSVNKGYVERIEDLPIPKTIQRNVETPYERFQKLLEPNPGKYLPEVFEYFTHAYKDIKKFLTKKDKNKLIKITNNVLSFDTSKIKVTLAYKYDSSKFSWTSIASYFGDALRTALLITPDIVKNYRNNIINFIPFAFSEDQVTILDALENVSDKELEFVYLAYTNTKSDLRYFMPSSFIYIISEFKSKGFNIKRSKGILLSLAKDENIKDNDRCSALEKYSLFVDRSDSVAEKELKSFFEQRNASNKTSKNLATIANSSLIGIFKDASSINWRFKELKRKAFPFEQPGGAHSVGAEEMELDTMSFAKPLINLKDPSFQNHFLDLLNSSLTLLRRKDNKYWPYINYLWKICVAYFENLSELGSFQPLLDLQKWSKIKLKGDKSNWLLGSISSLRVKYVNILGKKDLEDF